MLRAFCFFLLLTSSKLFSQRLLLDTYTPANGLVDARINKVFQDSKGFMYFLTWDGFSIFDGQHFDNYTEVDGLRVTMINDMIENPDHSVTLYGFNGVRYHIRNGRVTADTSMQKQLTEVSKVITIAPDDYLLLTNASIFRLQKGKLQKLKFSSKLISSPYINDAVLKGSRIIFYSWAMQDKGLFLYNYETQEVEDGGSMGPVTAIETDKAGHIYIFNNQWVQIDEAALAKGRLHGTTPWFEKHMPPDFDISYIKFDNDDNLWFINIDRGIWHFDRRTGEKKYFAVSDGLLHGITNIFQDRENNYWFCTLSSGVQKLQQSPLNRVQRLYDHDIEFAPIINPTIDGECLITSRNISFITNHPELNYTRRPPYCFTYWQNRFWMRSIDGKAIETSKGERFDIRQYIPDNIDENYTFSSRINIDKEGRLLMIGTLLISIDSNLHMEVMKLPYFGDQVIVDKNNDYWCFLRSDEVLRFSREKNRLLPAYRTYVHQLGPRSAIKWDDSTFVIGTRNMGIRLMRVRGDSLATIGFIDRSNGLSSEFVFSLLKTFDNELLAGTATGLDKIRFSGTDTIVERISARNNIFSPFTSIVQTKDSTIFAKTEDGRLYSFDKDRGAAPPVEPSILFRYVSVNGKKLDQQLEQRFEYTRNNFIFSVSAPSFLDNKNMRYRFVLRMKNKTWQQESSSADFAINNLEPGKYELTATAIFPGKVYTDKSISWTFTIQPPFWKTWWFITLLILTIIGSVVMLVRSYFRKQLAKQKAILEQQKAIEKERTRIATDMHDDFGASLSRIKFLSEKMQVEKKMESKDLQKISEFSDEMAEKMGEIVWALNRRYDSSGDLLSFCRSWASEYLNDKNIKLQFNTREWKDININGEIRRNIFLVMKESIHNIVKHAEATEVRIDMSCDEWLEVIIADNGKGFDPGSIRPFANGLDNMRRRMEEIVGTYSIEQKNGTLTSIRVRINRQ
jgi:signal transduction histidine kinase